MGRKIVMFFHGFASSRHSRKAVFFRRKFRAMRGYRFISFDFNPTPEDFRYMTISGMIDRIRQFTIDKRIRKMRVIASSMGALVALHFARRYGMVEKMLLLAPALFYRPRGITDDQLRQWKEQGEGEVYHYRFEKSIPLWYQFHLDGLRYSRPIPPPVKMTILHGRRDDVVPIVESRDYTKQYSGMIKLVEVDSDHFLHDHLDVAWQLVIEDLIT